MYLYASIIGPPDEQIQNYLKRSYLELSALVLAQFMLEFPICIKLKTLCACSSVNMYALVVF